MKIETAFPLLFETSSHTLFDAIIVVSAPPDVQRARLLARPGMTEDKLDALTARQLPDAEKRAKADFVVDTGVPPEDSYGQIDADVWMILESPPLAYQRRGYLRIADTWCIGIQRSLLMKNLPIKDRMLEIKVRIMRFLEVTLAFKTRISL